MYAIKPLQVFLVDIHLNMLTAFSLSMCTQGRHDNCCSDQVERECIFTSMPSRRQTDDQETMSNGQAMTMTEVEELGSWETTFELGTVAFPAK